MKIIRAAVEDSEFVAELFDQYRIFYRRNSDPEGAVQFIRERLNRQESVIFYAVEENETGRQAIGFTQLYPSFSSVSMQKLWILNDLYVSDNARRKGVAQSLLKKAVDFAAETNAKGVVLETSSDNYNAQRLYEKFGFIKNAGYHYFYLVSRSMG